VNPLHLEFMPRSRFVLRKALAVVLRVVVGGSFIYAGWVKVGDPAGFADSVASFAMLPNALISSFTLSLPIYEIGAGASILSGWPRRVGSLAILCVSVVFTIALAQAIGRNLDVNCGCFGVSASTTNPWVDLSRNFLTVLACLFLYRES
jgi:uncharacterized membrane protein YphA (DoxX/SURF4 family)